jgi:hypothetical protein
MKSGTLPDMSQGLALVEESEGGVGSSHRL